MRDGIVATIQTPLARLGFESNRSGIGMCANLMIWIGALHRTRVEPGMLMVYSRCTLVYLDLRGAPTRAYP
jgi:hypothetical protein